MSSPEEPQQIDPIIAREHDEAEGKELAETQQRDLRRYLQRVAGQNVPDPGRDLLYLEPAGATAGLDDAALGELIESDAPEAPERVVGALRERSPGEQRAAAHVLAEIADQEFGDERANVVTALVETAEMLGDDLTPIAPQLAESLTGFQKEQPLAGSHLTGALLIGLGAGRPGEALVGEVLADDRLLEDPGRTSSLLALLERIPSRFRKYLLDGVGPHVEEDPALLLDAVASLPSSRAVELLNAMAAEVQGRIQTWESEGRGDEVETFANSLYGAASRRDEGAGRALQAVQHALLPAVATYAVVRDQAPTVFAAAEDAAAADRDALLGVGQGPPEDWQFWAERLAGEPRDDPEERALASSAIIRVLSAFRAQDLDGQQAALTAVPAVAPYLGGSSEEQHDAILSVIHGALQAASWWGSEELIEVQHRLHRLAHEIAEALPTSADEIRRIRVEDVERGVVSPEWYASNSLSGLRTLGTACPPAAAKELLDRLMGQGVTGELQRDVDVMRTRATLAGTARRADASIGPEVVDQRMLIDGGTESVAGTSEAAAAWLRLDPSPDAVRGIAETGLEVRVRLRGPLGEWAGRRSEAERTSLLQQLIAQERDVSDWVAPISQSGVDEASVSGEIAALVKGAPNAERRLEVVRALVALRPQTSRGQKTVADIIEGLLGTGKKVDFDVALEAIPALGQGHRSTERLRSAFKAAAKDHGYKVPRRALEALADAGIKLPKKSLTASARDSVKSIFGR